MDIVACRHWPVSNGSIFLIHRTRVFHNFCRYDTSVNFSKCHWLILPSHEGWIVVQYHRHFCFKWRYSLHLVATVCFSVSANSCPSVTAVQVTRKFLYNSRNSRWQSECKWPAVQNLGQSSRGNCTCFYFWRYQISLLYVWDSWKDASMPKTGLICPSVSIQHWQTQGHS